MNMFLQFIINNYAPLTGLLFLFVFILFNKDLNQKIRRTFYVILGLEFVELILYSLELWMASFAEPTVWRILFSAIGYSICPVLILGILQLSVRNRFSNHQLLVLGIPAIVNVIAAFSGFFSDVVYSYNQANEFVRGPLGYTTHIILCIYLVCILIYSINTKKKHMHLENVIIWVICAVIVLAMVLEAVFSVRNLGRTAIVLCTVAYYLYFQTQSYNDQLKGYMENTIDSQKEHLREMNVIGVLANEYVTVCYVDVANDVVTPYRIDSVIDERYGDVLRSGVTFEKVFKAYVSNDVYEEDRGFFLNLADLQKMMDYLHQNGELSKKYRVLRKGTIVYCEMRVELVQAEEGTEDLVFGFSNNDARVRKEMVYESAVQQEINQVEETKKSLSGIADLARQLQEAIEDKLSIL